MAPGMLMISQSGFSSSSNAEYLISSDGLVEKSSKEKKATSGAVYGQLKINKTPYRITDVKASEQNIPFIWTYTFTEESCLAAVAPAAGVRRCVIRASIGDKAGYFILTQELAAKIHNSCG